MTHHMHMRLIRRASLYMTWPCLKLVCTYLSYRVLRASTAAIYLSNDHFVNAPTYLGWNGILHFIVWDQLDCQMRVVSDKIQKKILPTVGPEPTTLRFEVWCPTDWANKTWWMLYYLNDMYFRYQCKHWFKFENDEVERILSCKCTVLCYILTYLYCTITKRRSCLLFAYLPDLLFSFSNKTQKDW